MLLGNNKGQSSELTINGNVIEKVYKAKFLGVIIDDKLIWNDQINQVKSKLSKTISVLYKAKYLLHSDTLFMLYNSLFLPYLSYCTEVWANSYKS